MTVISVIGSTVLVLAGLGLLDCSGQIDGGMSIVMVAVAVVAFSAVLCSLVIYNLANINVSELNIIGTLPPEGLFHPDVRRLFCIFTAQG